MLGYAKASMTLDVSADSFDYNLAAVAVNWDVAMRSAAYWRKPDCALANENCSDQLRFCRVELRGFEPLTYSMRTSRATNCAIAPDR